MAVIKIAVFGADKLKLIRFAGKALVLFNLAVRMRSDNVVNHYFDSIVREAPSCDKTTTLLRDGKELRDDTNTHTITAEWAPIHQRIDVSGPQLVACSAFLDCTSENPTAKMPKVMQMNWLHIEEPEQGTEVTEKTGRQNLFLTKMRDGSGCAKASILRS